MSPDQKNFFNVYFEDKVDIIPIVQLRYSCWYRYDSFSDKVLHQWTLSEKNEKLPLFCKHQYFYGWTSSKDANLSLKAIGFMFRAISWWIMVKIDLKNYFREFIENFASSQGNSEKNTIPVEKIRTHWK